MKRTIAFVLTSLFATGCIFVADDGHRHKKKGRDCGPAYHYESGRGCVHNGKAKGHHKRDKHKNHKDKH